MLPVKHLFPLWVQKQLSSLRCSLVTLRMPSTPSSSNSRGFGFDLKSWVSPLWKRKCRQSSSVERCDRDVWEIMDSLLLTSTASWRPCNRLSLVQEIHTHTWVRVMGSLALWLPQKSWIHVFLLTVLAQPCRRTRLLQQPINSASADWMPRGTADTACLLWVSCWVPVTGFWKQLLCGVLRQATSLMWAALVSKGSLVSSAVLSSAAASGSSSVEERMRWAAAAGA